jgi:hypothetical protein
MWRADERHGYGVRADLRQKYLGEWRADKYHGRGTLANIDGVYYEAMFDDGAMKVHFPRAFQSPEFSVRHHDMSRRRAVCWRTQ